MRVSCSTATRTKPLRPSARSPARATRCTWAPMPPGRRPAGREAPPVASSTRSPQRDGAAFVARIADESSRERGTLVLPMTEQSTLLLRATAAACRPRARGWCCRRTKRCYARSTRRTRHSLRPRSAWPCLGPGRSSVMPMRAPARRTCPIPLSSNPGAPRSRRPAEPSADRRADVCGSRAELLTAWRAISTRCRSALVQEFVEGEGVGFFALMRQGEPGPSSRIGGCGTSGPPDREAPCA